MGHDLSDWRPPNLPPRTELRGRACTLEPFRCGHDAELFDAVSEDADGAIWRYLPDGPFATLDAYRAWFDAARIQHDPLHFAVRMADGRVGGSLSLLRMAPAAGSIEVGYITYAPRLQRTRAASEAVLLLARWAFYAGYRRFEWKCNAANAASCWAAERFGFAYEGTFRHASVVKGANRDTAWYAMTDSDFPRLDAGWTAWLADDNFDANGVQKRRLSECINPA